MQKTSNGTAEGAADAAKPTGDNKQNLTVSTKRSAAAALNLE